MGKESIQRPSQNELTSQANSPKLEKRGDIFMGPDQPKGPEPSRRPDRPGRIVPSKRLGRQPFIARPQDADSGERPAPTEKPPRAEQGESRGSGKTRESEQRAEVSQDSYMAAVRSLAEGLRPEFKVAIGSANTPKEAYDNLLSRYTAAVDDIHRMAENIPAGETKDEQEAARKLRADLGAKEKKLRQDFVETMEKIGQAAPDQTLPKREKTGDRSTDTNDMDGLRATIKDDKIRPEFKSIIDAAGSPDEVAVQVYEQYAKAFDVIDSRAKAIPHGPTGDASRVSLEAEKAKLRDDFRTVTEAFRRVIPERALAEADWAKVDAIEHMSAGPGKTEAIRSFILEDYFIRNSAADSPLPNEILKLIAQDDATTERFINDLIVMESENEPWQIKGFFGNINLEKFLKVMRSEWSNTPADIARRDRLRTWIDANRGFHDMNYILRRNFDQFGQQSEVIQPEHLRVLSQVPGVAEGIALYEELYTAERAREGYITEEAATRIGLEVEQQLGELAKESRADGAPLVKGVMGGRMEKWEVYRAHVYARDTFRILMRAVEQTALSDLPPGQQKFTTIALGKVAMVFDTLKFNGLRFEPAQQLGGPELLEKTREIMLDKRRGKWEKGKETKPNVRLTRVGGTEVGLMELQTIVAARGVLATWRAQQAVLKETRFTDSNGEITDVATFCLTHKVQIDALVERQRKDIKGKERDAIREETKVLFDPLLKGTSINLGLIASGFGLPQLDAFKELVWEKAAQQDPLVMAQLLTSVEVDSEVGEGLSGLRSLQDVLVRTWGTPEQTAVLIGVNNRLEEIDDMPDADKKAHETERAFLLSHRQAFEQKGRDCKKELGEKEKIKNPTDEDKQQIVSLRAEIQRNELGIMGMSELNAEIGRLSSKNVRTMTDVDRLRLDVAKQELGKKKEIVKQVLTGERWEALRGTLRTAHRMRMSDEVDRINRRMGKKREEAEVFGDPLGSAWEEDENGLFNETEAHFRERLTRVPKRLEDYLKNGKGEDILDAQQRHVLNEITANGTRIAPDLARIKRAYAWFLDDVPFQSINWEVLGQFYDREVNDLAGFNKSAQALITIVNNPFGVPTEKALDTFGEAVVAAGGILNEDASEDNIQPMFEAYLEMISKTGNRQIIWSELMHAFNQPTSRAQEIIGVKAPSVDEGGMRTILEESVPKHVTRKGGWDLKTGAFKWANRQAELIRHFHATPLRVFGWKNLRDFGPIGLLAILIEFFNGTFSTKSQAY